MTPETPQETNQPPLETSLTVNSLYRLFFASFEHSQGHVDFQNQIFHYLRHLHPNENPSLSLTEQVKTKARRAIPAFFEASGLHGDVNYLLGIHQEMQVLRDAFAQPEPVTGVIHQVAVYTLRRDYEHLVERGGRHNRTPVADEHLASRYHNTYFSYLCHYAFGGHRTGMWQFDRMYQDIRQSFVELPIYPETARIIEQVADVHNRHHPYQTVVLPNLKVQD